MRRLRYLIIVGSAAAALAVGLGAQAQTDRTDLASVLNNVWWAIS